MTYLAKKYNLCQLILLLLYKKHGNNLYRWQKISIITILVVDKNKSKLHSPPLKDA